MLLTDRIKVERLKRAIFDEQRLSELARKVNEYQEGVPVSPRLIEPKVAIPLLESATMEFDEELHTLWANLLASAMDKNAEYVENYYIEILKNLTPEDAKSLEKIWKLWENGVRTPRYSTVSKYGAGLRVDAEKTSLAKFLSLGLVESATVTFAPLDVKRKNNIIRGEEIELLNGGHVTVKTAENIVSFTELGVSFCRAIGLGDKEQK